MLALLSTRLNIVKRRRRRLAALSRFANLELTIRQLEEKVGQRIRADFKERISLQTECDLFIRYALAGSLTGIILPNVDTHPAWHSQLSSPSFGSSRPFVSRP